MTTTETPFDEFEQRLRHELSRSVGDLVAPDDGVEIALRRVAHRRRTRRATWVAAAAAVVLVVGAAAVLLRASTDDSSPYVDTSDSGGMPLLGFDTDTWTVGTYSPGFGYTVGNESADSDSTTILQVTREAFDDQLEGMERLPERTAELGGREVTVGTLRTVGADGAETFRAPGVWWYPALGYRAMVTTSSSSSGAESVTRIERMATSVVEIDLSTWLEHLRGEGTPTDARLPIEMPLMLPPPAAAESLVASVSSEATFAWIRRQDDGTWIRLGRFSEPTGIPQDDPREIEVRGHPGSISTGTGSDESLTWSEGGQHYVLTGESGVGDAELLSVAALLEPTTPDRWMELIFSDRLPPALIEVMRSGE
jgi:hypothetical protein